MKTEFVTEESPGVFCHGSTIAAVSGHTLVCCWFGGTREGAADTAVWGSRNCGSGWSAPVRLAAGSEAHWNPVLFAAAPGELLLFYKRGEHISSWRTLLQKSCDGGQRWSVPVEAVPGDISGGRGPVRNKPLRLSDGRILAGGSVERGLWTAFVDSSCDNGRSWHKSGEIKIDGLLYRAGEKSAESSIPVSAQSFYGRGVIQPALWESAPGKVHMLLRSSEGSIYRSDSADAGRSWCAAYPVGLPNNNSALDLVRAPFDGRLYLVCNPVADNWGVRSPLTLFRSADNGVSWEKIADLASGTGEFSYPAIIARENEIIVTYTWQRRKIACCRFHAGEL